MKQQFKFNGNGFCNFTIIGKNKTKLALYLNVNILFLEIPELHFQSKHVVKDYLKEIATLKLNIARKKLILEERSFLQFVLLHNVKSLNKRVKH